MSSDGAYPKPDPHHPDWTKQQVERYWCTLTAFKPGMCQEETCRDLGHVQMGLAAMWNVAETARSSLESPQEWSFTPASSLRRSPLLSYRHRPGSAGATSTGARGTHGRLPSTNRANVTASD